MRCSAVGIRLDLLDEHDWTSFQRFPWLVETAEETFVTPEGQHPGAPVLHPGGQPGLTDRASDRWCRFRRIGSVARSSGLRTVQPAPDTFRGS